MMGEDNGKKLEEVLENYRLCRVGIRSLEDALREKMEGLDLLKGGVADLISRASLSEIIESMPVNVRPRLVELSDCDQQSIHAVCMLIPAGHPELGILLRGNGAVLPGLLQSGIAGRKVSFGMTRDIYSGVFTLYPFKDHDKFYSGDEQSDDRISKAGVEFIVNFDQGKFCSMKGSMFDADVSDATLSWMFPWLKVHG